MPLLLLLLWAFFGGFKRLESREYVYIICMWLARNNRIWSQSLWLWYESKQHCYYSHEVWISALRWISIPSLIRIWERDRAAVLAIDGRQSQCAPSLVSLSLSLKLAFLIGDEECNWQVTKQMRVRFVKSTFCSNFEPQMMNVSEMKAQKEIIWCCCFTGSEAYLEMMDFWWEFSGNRKLRGENKIEPRP